MIIIRLTRKEKENLNEIISALSSLKDIDINKISNDTAEIAMPELYFETISHTLEYWGNFVMI